MLRRVLAALPAALLAAAGAPDAARAQPGAAPPHATAPNAGAPRAAGPDTSAPKALPLFASDSVLRLALATQLRALGGDRDTLHPHERPGTLTTPALDGAGPVALRVTVAARGHWRLARANCDFPPLRLTFDGAKHTPFRGQRVLKLVTHCRPTAEYEQHVLREHLAYRAAALVLPAALRTRLVRIRYAEPADSAKPSAEHWAMLVESERELARRTGARRLEARGAHWDDLADRGVPLALFAYFLGNTDFALGALHNVVLLQRANGTYAAVPYDFDFSGMVDTRYATPDPRLNIRSVRERTWRGPCVTADELAAALRPYQERRAELLALWRGGAAPGLDPGYGAEATRYAEDFFRETRDPARFARTLGADCQAAR